MGGSGGAVISEIARDADSDECAAAAWRGNRCACRKCRKR
ncbi:hypothetical protein HMPREF1313_1280 [Bifidobacterium longum subsp. longum 1-6B]|uniref:Uncharacterized protein n=2 Tax=Bifidobacterium longum subsp. longum TaxID=1679 RepID=A0AA87LSS9_BIFLL|nr:hypothetical protein BBG7_1951 [Bifidobacterium longum]EIJ23426.1 hypothetical protein HMPREF1314_0021 [Bifidobacterium longum subsp. longum 35B]EIJ27898.1 hypothetical protein HMPREF1315_1463 [Bifidobacterium longum subsp. longum 2-2B]EIJ28501.1 hypothetical protein HMPREF1313_1280 [Bifidobacterium longum subsp. longum 1-6B]EIJ32518.1 hypothetical protein HMPREF1312_1571 [Bifidobacterium longum subsp. longum 44B]EPE38062.1 hypothetical protein I118_2038 [Bifidobacterium longum D2957]CCK35